MKYLKRFHDSEEWAEVSKDDALYSVLGSYYDNAEVRSWLNSEGEIRCKYATIKVISELD